MGFYPCNQIRIERDNGKDGHRCFKAYTYDVVLAKWFVNEFPHSDAGLKEATQYVADRLMHVDM